MMRTLRYVVMALLGAIALTAPLAALRYEQAPMAGASVGPASPNGTSPICDLPKKLRAKNIGSPAPRFPGDRNSWGCCVFRSIDHAAHWQNMPELNGFPEWMVSKSIQGGGYPGKVDKLIPQICADRGMPTPDYLQVESNDLEIIKLACKTGRMVCSTYWYSPTGRYGGAKISHMVNTVHADDEWFAVLDNNYIDQLEWMSPQEYLGVYKGPASAMRRDPTGWSIIFLAPPPPPIPLPRSVK